MPLSEKNQKWILCHFKNTKNDFIMQKLKISHSALHQFARENGLKKTKQFQNKCQRNAALKGAEVNKLNNWPPKGYVIPKSVINRYKKGVTPEMRLGKKKNKERILKSAQNRKKTVLAEKRRVLFGLDQKTKLKVVAAPHAKNAFRYTLKKRGYVIGRGENTIYYDINTQRSKTCERTALKIHSFRIKQLIEFND
jgi:hypothetical protein